MIRDVAHRVNRLVCRPCRNQHPTTDKRCATRKMCVQHLDNLPSTRLSALEGGIHAVLEFAPSLSSHELATMLRSRGVLVDDLAAHSLSQPSGLNGLVIGYGSAPDMELVRGLELIRQGVTQQAGGPARSVQGKWPATKKSRPE